MDVVDTSRKEFLRAYVSLAHALSFDYDDSDRSFDNEEARIVRTARHDLLQWLVAISRSGELVAIR